MRGITKRFGQVAANDDINLELYCGEILAIRGKSMKTVREFTFALPMMPSCMGSE